MWDEPKNKDIKNLYTITALAWKKDGSRVTCVRIKKTVYLFTKEVMYHMFSLAKKIAEHI